MLCCENKARIQINGRRLKTTSQKRPLKALSKLASRTASFIDVRSSKTRPIIKVSKAELI
jgi:hypothetical protein